MLSDCDRRLLTAYVDGELTARQQRAADDLLARSAEARSLLEQLEADASKLRALSVPALTIDLSGPVLEAIYRRRLTPAKARALSPTPAIPVWAGLALAASVLVVLGLASYGFLAQPFNNDTAPPSLAKADPVDPPPVIDAPKTQVADGAATPEPAPQPELVPQPEPPQLVQKNERPEPKPDTPTPEPKPMRPVEAAPSFDQFEIRTIQVHPPVVHRLRDLDQDVAARRMLDDLRADTAFRIELPCGHAVKALDRLQAVGRRQQFGFVVDSAAAARMKTVAQRSHFAVYLEGVTAAELVKLFAEIGGEDRKGLGKRPPDVQFHDSLVLARMNKSDRKELADLLGIDTTVPLPPRSLGPLGTDPTKSLTDLTAAQVGDSLAGQGSTRPESGKAVAKPPKHFGLVLAYAPVRSRPASAEVKRFVDARKPAQQGSLQVLLILRTMN